MPRSTTRVGAGLLLTALLGPGLRAQPDGAARMQALMKDYQAAALQRDAAAALRAGREIQALAERSWTQGDYRTAAAFYVRSHADTHRQLQLAGGSPRLPPGALVASHVPLARALVWYLVSGEDSQARVVLKDAVALHAAAPDPVHPLWLFFREVIQQAPRPGERVLEFLAAAHARALEGLPQGLEKVRERATAVALVEIGRGYRMLYEGRGPTESTLAQAGTLSADAYLHASGPAEGRILPRALYYAEEFRARLDRGEKSRALELEKSLVALRNDLVRSKGKGAVWGFLQTAIADAYYLRHPEKLQEALRPESLFGAALGTTPKSTPARGASAKAPPGPSLAEDLGGVMDWLDGEDEAPPAPPPATRRVPPLAPLPATPAATPSLRERIEAARRRVREDHAARAGP